MLSIVGFGSHYFIVTRGLRILGVAYTLTILELTNFLFYNTVRFLVCDRATYRFPGFRELFRGMGAFTVKVGQSLWIALADTWAFFYNLFLMNRSQVKVDIAAYTSIMTMGAFFFFTCLGIGGTIRTNVGRIIGEGLRASAKREAQGYILIALLFVAIMSAGLLVFARQMACWYSPSEEMQVRLTFGIRTYRCFLVGYVLLNPIFTIYRLVDLDRVIVVTSGIVFPTLVVSATSFMVLYLKWGVYGVFLGYGSFQTLAVCILAGYIFGVHQWGSDILEPRVIPELPPSPEPVSMMEDKLIE